MMNKPSKPPTVEDALGELDAMKQLNIAQRLNLVMAQVDYVQRERPSGLSYSIVSHDAVTRLVRPLLQSYRIIYYPHSLDVRQNGNRTEAVFKVRFENIDQRDDFIDVDTFGYGVDSQDKGPGKAMSYGVKYALLKALGLETGDDPDLTSGNEAEHKPDTITQGQVDDLRALASEVGANVPRFCKYIGVEKLEDIRPQNFAAAVDALKAKKKERANA